jgi:hypothetical protein
VRRALALVASALACLAIAAGTAGAQAAAAPAARRALLVRGAVPARGLPFFPPNAISCLSGAYSLASDPGKLPGGEKAREVGVWYTREALVLTAAWKKAPAFGAGAMSLARDRALVLVLKDPRYYLLFDFPQALDEATMGAFALAFGRKFQAFLENAATEAELSFPAFVDY